VLVAVQVTLADVEVPVSSFKVKALLLLFPLALFQLVVGTTPAASVALMAVLPPVKSILMTPWPGVTAVFTRVVAMKTPTITTIVKISPT
jgi:hypothetical protein